MKIRPVGAELFHADGRTDMTKLIVTFLNFANTPKNVKVRPITCHEGIGSRYLVVLFL
jgi:hypothetical protein